MNIKYKLVSFVVFITFAIIMALSIRGLPGNPTANEINQLRWKDNGPFELSPERGRYSLTKSIVDDNSLSYSLDIARFTTPDLGYYNGKYVSLFAPLVSFMIIPGYIFGKIFEMEQVGAYAVISIFAVLNTILIRQIALKLKASRTSSLIASLTFLFATPAYAYGVSLYQHHFSTFFILLGIYLLLRYNNLISLSMLWILCAASIPLDYPNLFLMLPIAIYASARVINFKKAKEKILINIKPLYILTIFTAILPLLFFFWFNSASYGNPLQLSGTVPSVKTIDQNGKPVITINNDTAEKISDPKKIENKNVLGFFNTRNFLNGFYIHFFSPDRGIIYFAPIVLFGIFGWIMLNKKENSIALLFISITGINVILYSMWNDPWGGWAFGSRYLIPTYAILSILISFVLDRFKKNIFILVLFFIILTYSVLVNSLGALTTNRNPPQVEVLALEKLSGNVEKYTYERNWDYINIVGSKSYFWNITAKNYMSASQYHIFISTILISLSLILLINLNYTARIKENVYEK